MLNEIDKFLKYFIEPKTNHGRSGVQWIKSELTKYGKNHFSELIVYSDYYSVASTIVLTLLLEIIINNLYWIYSIFNDVIKLKIIINEIL